MIFPSHVLHTFQIFSKALSLSLLDRSNLSPFCRFLPQIFKGFLSSSLSKSLLTLSLHSFSHFSCIYMHFSLKISNMGFLGFVIFGLFLIIFDQWIFVLRFCKQVSHDLI